MAIRTPFDFPMDPPGADDEKMVSVTDPMGAAPGDSTFYLVRRFDFVEGDYTITFNADDAATLWIGTSQLNSRMVGSTVLGTPGEVFVNIPAGSYRLDVILQNFPASPAYFTMVIKRGDTVVYASSKEGWLLDDVPISDDDLPEPEDYRRKLPVFSVLPNWAAGVLERLSWLTNVMGSEKDAEQRRSVRRNARRSFDVNFLRQNAHRDRLDTFFVGVGASRFMMPLWHEAVKMMDGLDMEASGVFFEDGLFNMREFRKGDLVFVNGGDPDNYDILEVGDTETHRFSWKYPPPRAWPPGTRIYPMRVATLNSQAPRMSNITDTVSTATARFDLVEPYSVPEAWGGNLGGQPLFRFIPDRVQPIEVEYQHRNFTLDNLSGIPLTTEHGRFTSTQVQMRLSLFGRADAYAFRQFLQAARGMTRHFNMPTFMQDVELIGDIPAESIDLLIRNQGYYDYMLRPQPVRLQLAFQFRDKGQTVYRSIRNVTQIYKMNPSGEAAFPLQVVAELLTLDAPMPAISVKALRRVSFVVETRFAQDTFEIHHPTNGQEQVSTSLVFRQTLNQRSAK